MRRGRIFILLAIIIIIGLGAVFLVQQNFFPLGTSSGGSDTVEGQTAPAPASSTETVEIIVVAQDVQRGTVLQSNYLSTIEWPQDNFLETMFRADEMVSVIGRQARHDIDNGTPLTVGMLIDVNESLSDTGSIASLSIPKGMVAIPVPVDRERSVAYSLRPGDHVSVIGTFVVVDIDTEFQSKLPNSVGGVISTGSAGEGQPSYLTVQIFPSGDGTVVGRTELDPLLNELVYVMPAEAQRPRLVTQILMQDATVLRYGEFSYEDLRPEEPVPAEGEAATAEGEAAPVSEQEPPDIVTLIVTPQEAVALEHMMKSDIDITLVLRSSGDTDPIDTEAVTFQYMLETYNIPIPAKLPYGLETQSDSPTPAGDPNQ
jgi:Flp pilus assembly protein CpaB